MANLLEVLGVSPDDMGSVPQDIKDASTLLEGMQDIYEEMPISKRKEEFANVISEGVKQLLIRLGALTRLGVQSTQNIQQQLPTNQDYRGSLYVRTSKIDNYKSPFYTLYAVNSDFTFPNGARTLNSIYYKKNDSTQYFSTDTIEEFEDAINDVITMLPFKMGDVFEFKIDTIPNQPNGKGYISINGYDSNGLIVSYWSVWDDINNSEPLIIIDNEAVSIFEKFLTSDKNIIQNTTENINNGKYVKVENVAIPTKKNKNLDGLIPLEQAQGAIIPDVTKGLRIFTDENLGKQNANLLNIAPIEIIQHTTNVPISQVPIKHFEERGYIVNTKDVTQLYETSEAGNLQSYERIDFVVEGDIVLLESLKGDKMLGEVKFDNTINEWYIQVTSGSTKWAKFKQDYLFSSKNTNPSVKLYEGVKSFSKTSTTPTPPQTSTPQPPTPPTNTPQPPKSTPTPPTPPPTKPTKPSKPTPPKTSTPPTPPPSDDEPKQMTKSEIEDAIKGLNILAKLGDKDAKASIKGLKVLLKYA